MDDSNENEAHETLRSPPRRRRSTFFERRDSCVPQTSEIVAPSTCKSRTDTEGKNSNDLLRYHDKLLTEKEQWKREVNDRRNKYHDIRQQYKMAVKESGRSRMAYSALSNEDIEFLKGKTNITKLVDSQSKLHESVKKTRALYRKACDLDNVILNLCEEKVNKITEYIWENSTVEPIDSS